MRLDAAGNLHPRLEDGGDALSGGTIRYRIEDGPGRRTPVQVSADIVPATDPPPLVGPAVMRHLLAEYVREWAQGIDRLAQASDIRFRVALGSTSSI